MKCPHCGEELPEEYVYVAKDSEQPIENEQADESADESVDKITAENTAEPSALTDIQNSIEPYSSTPITQKKARLIKRIVCAAAVVAVIVGGTVGINAHNTSALRHKMSGTWTSSGNLMTTATLTVTGSTISYSETFGFMEMNGQTVPYKAVSKNAISIQGIRHEVTVDSDSGTMTITPGISTNGAEVWYSSTAQSSSDESDSSADSNEASDGVL